MQAFQEHLWSQRLWRQQADNPAASRDPTTFPRASRRRGPSSNHGVGRARRYGSPVRSCSMGMTPSYEVIAHYKALAPPRLAVYQTHKPWSRACDAGPVRKETTAGQHAPRVSNAPPGPLVSLARATPSCRATAGCCWGGPRIARSALRGWRRRRHARASHTPGPGGPSSSQAASRGRGFRAPPRAAPFERATLERDCLESQEKADYGNHPRDNEFLLSEVPPRPAHLPRKTPLTN